ncbi:MAG: toprim domain-containing protein, partial [Pseudomonadota bacterium]
PSAGRAPYDTFRGRVMFPITDRRGRVVAFGGRIIGDGQPKYLNSPETPIFHKRRTLFGFATARRPALEAGEIVVVEGYMDVIAMHRAGVPHAVAPLGTALTEEQLHELWRVTSEPTVCFDGDNAGQKAARRAADVALPLLKPGQSLKFCILPPGQDPDDLLSSGGSSAVKETLAATEPLVNIVWHDETDGRDFTTPERQAGLKRALRDRVRRIEDRTVQEQYRIYFDSVFAEHFGGAVGTGGMRSGAQAGDFKEARVDGFGHGYNDGFADGRGGRYRRNQRQQSYANRGVLAGAGIKSGTSALRTKIEAAFLATALNQTAIALRDAEQIALAELQDPHLNQLRACLLDVLANHGELDSRTLCGQLSEYGVDETISRVLSDETYVHAGFAKPGADIDSVETGWQELLNRLALEPEAANDRKAEGDVVADDLTDESWERLKAKLMVDDEGTASGSSFE